MTHLGWLHVVVSANDSFSCGITLTVLWSVLTLLLRVKMNCSSVGCTFERMISPANVAFQSDASILDVEQISHCQCQRDSRLLGC